MEEDLYQQQTNKRSKEQRISRFKKLISHNFTLEDFEKMLENQNFRCKICKKVLTESKNMALDHCHKERRVRGILCIGCNTAIGLFGDDVNRLLDAIIYLKTN